MSVEATPAPPSAAPDWDAIEEDIHCPLCAYNLRGLIEPRCPECGYEFDWPEVLDPTKRLHPYLFEHHPEQNVKSFVRTTLGAWFPICFWTTLIPTQPSFPFRLVLYWFIAAGALASGLMVVNFIRGYAFAVRYPFQPALNSAFQWAFSAFSLVPIAALIIWPWIVFAALQVFQISMLQARVRSIHSLRCVLYSYDLTIAMAVIAVAALSLIGPLVPTLTWLIAPLPFYACLAIILVTLYRMWIAYRRYLRFDHAFLTVLAANIIAVLVLFIMVLFVTRFFA